MFSDSTMNSLHCDRPTFRRGYSTENFGLQMLGGHMASAELEPITGI